MLDGTINSPEPNTPLAAHSIFFEILGDLGFPGFLLFMAILVTGFYNLRRILRLTRGDPSLIWAYDLAVLFRVSLVVFIVCGALLSAAYFELLYIMLSQISVLRRHLEETTPAAAKPRPGWLAPAYDAPPGGSWTQEGGTLLTRAGLEESGETGKNPGFRDRR